MNPDLEKKYDRLKSILHDLGSVVIGYSGGVDSTFLLKVAVDTLGDNTLAVIAKSETYPVREFEEAVRTARAIGSRFAEIRTRETDDIRFTANPVDRCYHCKTELFSKLRAIAEERGIKWIADGTIADDLADNRPGMKAGKEQNIRSPLMEANLYKTEIREISRLLGLPTWDKGSFACLSSRFPYGTSITKDALKKIESAETLFRDEGFKYYRVRYHDERTARIEVGAEEIARFFEDDLRRKIVGHLKKIGFIYITLDLQGYRTGSQNEVL